MSDARKYLFFMCLPAALLTVAGLALLFVVRGQFKLARSVDYIRYADRVARSVSPDKFSSMQRAVFHWSPKTGLVDSMRLGPELAEALKGTNVEWVAEGRKAKPPKIG